jgi:hypothetical protein
MIKKAPLNDITQSSAERLCNASVFKRYKTLLHLALYINFSVIQRFTTFSDEQFKNTCVQERCHKYSKGHPVSSEKLHI